MDKTKNSLNSRCFRHLLLAILGGWSRKRSGGGKVPRAGEELAARE